MRSGICSRSPESRRSVRDAMWNRLSSLPESNILHVTSNCDSGNKGMPLPQSESKLSRTLAREEVYGRLRAWIIDGRLRPGELLRDQDIAATVGVSRTPVREALRRLEDEGLVETALNRWTRVAPIDVGKAAEIYAIVEALELFALGTAIRRLTPQDMTRMREANQAMRRAAELQDPAAAVIADESFHEVWIERANNGELSALLRSVQDQVATRGACLF